MLFTTQTRDLSRPTYYCDFQILHQEKRDKTNKWWWWWWWRWQGDDKDDDDDYDIDSDTDDNDDGDDDNDDDEMTNIPIYITLNVMNLQIRWNWLDGGAYLWNLPLPSQKCQRLLL